MTQAATALPPEPAPSPAAPAAPHDAPAPSAPAPGLRLERADFIALFALFILFLATRGAAFPYAQNLYGDAVVRSEIAERWAKDPHVIRSFNDDVYQFGPLHFYYMGSLIKLWPSREHASRLASLIAGLLFLLPFYRLGRRLFSRRAAILSSVLAGLWCLHIQASTTAASEALMLTLMFFAFDFLFQGIEEDRFKPLAWAALFLNLACATRYDGWMFMPLFCLCILFGGKDRIAGLTRAVLFGLLLLPFPLWWMQGNERAMGDPLYPIHYIDKFHANWVNDGINWLGANRYRIHNALFWPATLLGTCSVLAGVFCIAGMVHAFVVKERRALAFLALIPTAYFTFRGAILLNFSPLARFTMLQLAIALLYFDEGLTWVTGRLPSAVRSGALMASLAVAVVTPAWLFHFTAWKAGLWQDTLRPIAPLSTVPVDQAAAAELIKKSVSPTEALLVDEDAQYVDITVAYFCGVPEERLARRRWDNFEKQLGLLGTPAWLFTTKQSTLARDGLKPGEPTVTWRGHTYALQQAFSGRYFVYRLQ